MMKTFFHGSDSGFLLWKSIVTIFLCTVLICSVMNNFKAKFELSVKERKMADVLWENKYEND